MKKTRKLTVFFILLAYTYANAAIYKWTDAEGKVHYSDKKITKNSTTEIKAAPAASEADVNEASEKLNKIKQDLEASKKLKAQQQEEERQASEKALKKKQACVDLLDKIEHVKYSPSVYREDEAGNKVYYDEKTRAQRVDQYQQTYNKNCL